MAFRKNLLRMLAAVAVVAGAQAATHVAADQTTINNYETARDKFFWPMLYVLGGETLYCGIAFGADLELEIANETLTVEHAFPAAWIAEARGCPNRNDCDDEVFKRAEADLHNLWPALGRINSSRSDIPFGELPGEEERRFEDICADFERSSTPIAVVEPRDSVKGDIARSIFYMAIMYELPLHGAGELLIEWHLDDPPDEHELWRNKRIEQLQGTKNPFIGD
jgi:deoxyribonuclease I